MTSAPVPIEAQIAEAELHAAGLAAKAEQQRQNKRLGPEVAERTASRVPAAEAIVATLRRASEVIRG